MDSPPLALCVAPDHSSLLRRSRSMRPASLPSALHAFAEAATGCTLRQAEPLPGGASARRFFRFVMAGADPGRDAHERKKSEQSWIGVIGADAGENRAFLGFTRHFSACGLPVPRILAEDEARGLYLMEDLGAQTLADRLAVWDGNALARAALEEVLEWLPRFQVRGGAGLDYGLCHEDPELDAAVFRADLERFLRVYLPHHAPALPAVPWGELEALVAGLAAVPRVHFCYRDFQTRNIMWNAGPVFLDYQGGRRGALHYDLASFLYSPDSRLTEAEREHLINVYLKALEGCGVVLAPQLFLADFYPFVLVRRLQALGAYAHLAQPSYLKKIPVALADLRGLLHEERLALGLPALKSWLAQLTAE